MKNFLLLFCFLCSYSYAQNLSTKTYTVNGILQDSTKQTIIGAAVKLITPEDTISTSTNIDGVFSFKNVKSTSFKISASSLGYAPILNSYSYKPEVPHISLPVITMKDQLNMLNQVIIDGTPTIVFKTDTTEYKASDYNVRENATVEDLVKKMEGMEVDKDGALTVQGEPVTRARINGKDYFGDDLAAALKDLPSDIVDKIQIVDDYGDEANRTGIKDGEAKKILNIVTKADKKVGNRARIIAGAGSDDRYRGVLNANRFNGNQQIAIRTDFNNTITGIAGGRDDSGGSGGTRKSSSAGFNYNDDLSKKVKLNMSYNFRNSKNNATNSSTSEEYNQIGTIYTSRDGTSESKNKSHNFEAKLEYEIDSASWLVFSPKLNFSNSSDFSDSKQFKTGALKRDQLNTNSNTTSKPDVGFNLNVGHRFNKKGTTLSLNLSANQTNTEQDRNSDNTTTYYDQDTQDFEKDSVLKRLINVDNLSENYRSSLTFSQPLNEKSRLEFNAQINYRGYDNDQVTNVLDKFDNIHRDDSLSRIFNYSFTESRFALNYRFKEEKYSYSLGLTAIPALLKGESESRNNTTKRTSLNIVPIFRFEYKWSKLMKLTFRYYGNPTEPSYDQIQDVPDVTNPQNTIYGNPNLKAAFRHHVSSEFKDYITDSKITITAGIDAVVNRNQVIRNTVYIYDADSALQRETRFLNANGSHSYNGSYGFSKRFEDKYAINFNGNVRFNQSVSRNGGLENIGKTWSNNERLGLQITPQEWLEIVPNLRYNYSTTDFSLPTSRDNYNTNWALSLEGKLYFIKTLFLSYDLSKNYVKGINANISTNPFIINASLTKEFFKRNNGAISLKTYDILNQNNFVSRKITDNGFTDTKSNALSRYFMVYLSWAPQKWTGGKKGKSKSSHSGDKRRGDGSYID